MSSVSIREPFIEFSANQPETRVQRLDELMMGKEKAHHMATSAYHSKLKMLSEIAVLFS